MNDLIVNPHPLASTGRVVTQAAELRPGEGLAAFVTRNGVDLSLPGWELRISGARVTRLMWERTRPQHGQLIECRRVAQKSVLRFVALVALAYFTFGAGAFITAGTTIFGTAIGAFGASLINAGLFMLGSMLVNKLLPPPQARLSSYETQTGTTYSLSGGRNRARPFEPLGLVFGSLKVVPDYATQPYSWFASDEQYQYVRLHAGINCGAVATIQIGNTPIGSFADVTVSQAGFPGTTTKLQDWASVDTIAGATLDAATAPGAWVTRTSSVDTVMLAVDIGAQLYSLNDDGSNATATAVIEAERRLLPGGAWVPFIGASAALTLTSKSTKPLRQTLQTVTLTAGQYEVRLRKMTLNVATTRAANAIEWGTLKSYQQDDNSYSGQPQVGIRIKASGQVNGTLDEVNWIATSAAVPVWNGSAWVTQPSRNPGAHMLQLARGIYDGSGRLMAGMGLPDAQIDIETLKLFMVHCAANGYTFDHYFDAQVSCHDMLQAFAAAGLGSLSFHPGRLSVVWLTPNDPVEDVVTMANMKPGTFRVDYATRETAEELEVTWQDRDNGWLAQSVRVKAPGVAMPRDTARYAPVGATTQAAGLLAARFTMGQNIYQRKSVSWEMDLEHLALRRYSVLALSHDVTQWGSAGRLHAAARPGGVVTLELDEAVQWNSAATVRHVGLRIPGEVGYRIFNVVAFTGTVHALTLVEPWPDGVPFPGDAVDNPAHDTLWIYDFKAAPGQRLRVVAIEPTFDLEGAKITAVPESDEFWTYVASGTYTAPALPPAAAALAASNVVVTQERAAVNYDATTELAVTFDAVGPFDHAQVWGGPAGLPLQYLGSTLTRRYAPWRVGNEGSFTVEVRPFDALGRAGAVASATKLVVLDAVRAAARLLLLQSSSMIFQIDKSNAHTPASITFTASGSNLAGAPVISVLAGTATLGGSGGTRTLAFADMGTDSVTVQVAQDGLTDTVTVVKLREGIDGASGGATVGSVQSNESHLLAADAAGTVLTFAGASSTIKVYVGLTDDTANWTIAKADSAGVTSTLAGATVTVTAMTADSGYVDITATRSGYPTQVLRFSLAKSRAGAAGADAKRSLIDPSWWQPGAAFQWALNQTDAGENAIVWGVGPRGAVQALWQAVAAGTPGVAQDGGWTTGAIATTPTNAFVPDVTKAYRFAVPVKLVSGSGAWYWGPSGVVCNLNTATANTNPYFVASSTRPEGKWCLLVGYVFPAGSTGLTNAGAGIFDMESGELIEAGYNFCWQAEAVECSTRAYQFYASTGATQLFAPPAVELVDGTETAWVAGPRGANAKVLRLVASSQAFQINKAGGSTPALITFTASGSNLGGAPVISVLVGTATLGGSGGTRTLALADMGTDSVTVQVAQDGLADTITVVKLREGANGEASITAVQSNEAHVLAADAAGTVGSFAGAATTVTVYSGTTDVTGLWTLTKADSAGVGSTLAGATVTVTSMSTDSGYVDITATRTGYPTQVLRFSLSKSRAGTQGNGLFTVVTRGGVTAAGGTITRTGGADQDWSGDAYSLEAYTNGAFCSWQPGQTNRYCMMGLNADPATDSSYASMDYAWYASGDGTCQIYQSGGLVSTFGSYTTATVFSIIYDGAVVRYFKDGLLMHFSTPGAGLKLSLDSSFYDIGASIVNARFGPTGAAGANGANAKAVALAASSQLFVISKSGGVLPSTITFTASGQNVSGAPTFAISGGGVLTGTGTTRALAFADMTVDAVTVTMTWDTLSDTVTVAKVREGTDSIVALLDNEAHVVAAANDGSVGSFAGASSTMKILSGAVDVTGLWTITKADSAGVTSTLAGATVTVTAMTADNAYVDLTATRAGFATQTVRFSISKARAGATGAAASQPINAKLSSYTGAVQANAAGVVQPGGFDSAVTTITIEEGQANVTGSWTLTRVDGASITSALVGNVLSITAMAADTAAVTITATRSGYPTQTLTYAVTKVRSAVDTTGPLANAGYFNAASYGLGSNQARAVVRFRPDGTVQVQEYSGGSGAFVTVGAWYTPTTSGIGAAYYMRTTKTAGQVLTSGSLASWDRLDVERSFVMSKSSGSGSLEAFLSHVFSASAGGATVGSAQSYLQVEYNT